MVWTEPMYNPNWTYGAVLGTVNGVEVRCNDTYDNLDYYKDNQCTEFCARYYSQIYNKTFSYSTAFTWYGTASNKGLARYQNGVSTSLAPRPGDILCMSGGPGSFGHVAIIIEVGWNYVSIAQQNSGTIGGSWAPIGAQLTYDPSTKTISPPSSSTPFTVQGWLRMP